MRKITCLLSVIAVCAGVSTIAEDANLLASKDLKNWKGAKVIADGKVLEATNSKLIASKIVPINPKSAYVLTGMFKSGNAKKNRVYFGMQFFNAKKQYIHPTTVTPIARSGTELVADGKKGAKVILLKNASAMVKAAKIKRLQIGFDSDKGLPNTKLSSIVTKLEKKGDSWEATLSKPLAFAVAKGTKIMGHNVCGHYMYVVSVTRNFKSWTKMTGPIVAEVKTGSPGRSIWPGAKFGRVIVLANWGQKKGEVLQVKDVSLTAKAK